ncbi:MAG: GNAT family N-acetyltransferase [Rhodospirillales bacterium]|nr:GNAT family N-acetyltransferase [Rhodospirillales bacterium]
MSKDTIISIAQSSADIEDARQLFVEYQKWLKQPVCFEGFEEEMASLPGKYARPKGALLIAKDNEGNIAGGVGLEWIEGDICEMKRLFVRSEWRETHLGRRLAKKTVEIARMAGHKTMRLDTLETLASAIKLYKSMGFSEVDGSGKEGVIFMEMAL